MEYYVIYNLNDDIVAYIDTKKELSNFTGLRIKDINYKFKNRKFINVVINEAFYKVYNFC